MKKAFILAVIMLVVASPVLAADFAPTMLKLSAEPLIQYEFDGSNLNIPVQVSGSSAGIIFCVFTRGMADQIPKTINGYLGWHEVNKIDTCLYFSPLKSVSIGATTVTWNGKDQDGGVVPAGNYTYYMWAFDNQGNKQLMSNILQSSGWYDYYTDIQEVDTDGLPLPNPIWYNAYNPNVRWKIGNDPLDDTLRETCAISLEEGWRLYGNPSMEPTNFDFFYLGQVNEDAGNMRIVKYKWVPDGNAEIQSDFGEGGYSELVGCAGGLHRWGPGTATDGQYLYICDENILSANVAEPDADFTILDFDGYIVDQVDLREWWTDPDDGEAGGQMNGGPLNWKHRNGKFFLNSHGSCMHQMIDPIKYLETEDMDDLCQWANANGDYVLDHNYEPTAQLPWVCNDYNVGPYIYCIAPDANFFTACNAYDAGAVSFGLLAPDGTGLGYFAYAGETAGQKMGTLVVDSNTPFDGIYCDNHQTGGPHYERNASMDTPGVFFIGHDSITGVITNAVSVEDDAPDAFSVAQNTPNPFNPTTTIGFSVAESGNVSVDVFNVSGQKVATLTDGYMEAGTHSVVWDASGFSAGVYFYTVKTASHSKTMKMTLVK